MNFCVKASHSLCTGSFEALSYPLAVDSLCFGCSKFSDTLLFRCFSLGSGYFPLVKQLFTSISLYFSMEFVYVVAHAHQQKFRSDVFLSPHQKSSESAVFFYDAKGAFDLDGPIHSKKNSFGSRYVFQGVLP